MLHTAGMWRWIGVLAMALSLELGCATADAAGPAADSVLADIPYRQGPIPPQTKVFLVAGGDDIANFAAEVVEQRRLWVAAGVAADEIVCYYAKPSEQGWRDDAQQYRQIADDLQQCFAADPARLQADLKTVAAQTPDWVYVYVTGHGVQTLVDERKGRSLSSGERAELQTHAIGLQAGPSPRLGQIDRLVRARRAGTPLHELALTPTGLRHALSQFPADTYKAVVLQACFSGGFIGHDPTADEPPETSELHDVPNLVVLTAAAASRPSFGCQAGSHRTYFGAAYNHALAEALEAGAQPPHLPWREIFEQAAYAVRVMEAVDGERPSLPGFLSTVRF